MKVLIPVKRKYISNFDRQALLQAKTVSESFQAICLKSVCCVVGVRGEVRSLSSHLLHLSTDSVIAITELVIDCLSRVDCLYNFVNE